jgi:Protein of unknown function (DUF2846)
MMKQSHVRPSLLVSLLLTLAGCQTATLQSTADDSAAKRFSTPPGQATIYIYRPSALAGGARVEPVFIDGRMLGQNGSGTFLMIHVGAGHHTVATTAHSLTLDADVGKAYFIRQTHSAWGPSSSLARVTEEEGKKGVVACERAAGLF